MTDSAELDTNSGDVALWKGELEGLDHAVIRVPNLDEAVVWYQQLLGLAVTERRPGRVFLASPVTGRVVLGLVEGGTGLEYVSFRAHSAEAFERVLGRLADAGVETKRGSGGTRSGASDALRVSLPTGHVLEVLTAETEAPNLMEGAHRPGAFDVRASHIQFRTTDVAGLTAFLSTFGFKSTTYVQLPDGAYFIQFLRVNDRHHQLAVLTGEPGVHHVALEVGEADFWRFLDNLALYKIPAEFGPARHYDGKFLSIYVRDPFGNRIEVTGPMEAIGFDTPPHSADQEPWYHMNMWGPQPPQSWETEWM